jgi:hypothetical protein
MYMLFMWVWDVGMSSFVDHVPVFRGQHEASLWLDRAKKKQQAVVKDFAPCDL